MQQDLTGQRDLPGMSDGLYYYEFGGGADLQVHQVKRVVVSDDTPFQKVDIIEVPHLGKCLFLDGRLQSAQNDEFIYHEAMVHPALVCCSAVESVFIIGGGEGATLREVLRYNCVKRAVMCDIDRDVVKLSREYLFEWHRGAFDDPRAHLIHQDARAYLEADSTRYDAIIMDISEPLEDSPARLLFTREFFEIIHSRLSRDGVFCLQSGCGNPNDLGLCAAIQNTLSTVFSHCAPLQVMVPSFYSLWTFTVASDSIDPSRLTADEIDRRLVKHGVTGLNFYDGTLGQGLFKLPVYFRNIISENSVISTDEQPYVITDFKKPRSSLCHLSTS